MTLFARAALVLAASILPASALAAALGSAVSPRAVSVAGGETRTFIARFTNPDGTPAAGAKVEWANDVCGTFPNKSSTASGTTDADGVASIPFTAAGNTDLTCSLTASVGATTVEFDVATLRRGSVAFAPRAVTKEAPAQRGREFVAPPRSISGPAPGGGTQTLSVSSASAACGFGAGSTILDPAVTEFRRESAPARGLAYTEGIFSIRAENCFGPTPATFTLTTSRAVPAGSMFWMLSATKEKPVAHWHPVPATVSGNSVSFSLTDGVNDGDLVTDGVITAFGGLAVAPPWYLELQDLWWGGIGENGWGVSIVQHDEKLFAVIFAYDANGMPTWYVMPGGSWNAARTVFTGALYSPRGAPYTAYDPSRLDVGPSVGGVTLTFTDGTHATLDYVINGMVGRKQITRSVFGQALGHARPAVGDMWWGGERQNGWGIAILQQFGTLFAAWFTYNEKGEPTWFVMPTGTWTAADTFEGRIYRTASSRFLAMSYNTSAFRVADVGSFRVRFTAPDTAVFEWSIDGRSGSMPLSRQQF